MNEQPPPAPDFDAPALAKHLLRTLRTGALATLDRAAGFPFASLVTVATDLDGSPLLLMSQLSAHTLNLERDSRASLLLAQGGKGDPLAHPRLTVIGRAERTTEPRARGRFLARHPKAKLYADFADFSFWRLEIAGAHLNGGFARAMALEAGRRPLGPLGRRRADRGRGGRCRPSERRPSRRAGALRDRLGRDAARRLARDGPRP